MCILRRQPLLSGCLLIFSLLNIRNRFPIFQQLYIIYPCIFAYQNNTMNKYGELRLTSLITYFAIVIIRIPISIYKWPLPSFSSHCTSILSESFVNPTLLTYQIIMWREKKQQKHFQNFPSLLVQWIDISIYFYVIHIYNLPDLLTSSHFHLFVLHLKIVEFWLARSNHNINIQRQIIINSYHSTHAPIPKFYAFLFIDALEVMLWCASLEGDGFVLSCLKSCVCFSVLVVCVF